jgi:mRNA interferase MazF
VTVAVCSSNISRKVEPTQLLIEGKEIETAGIRVPSVIKCETLITVNKSMVVRKLGKLSVRARKELDECLRNALNL